MAGKRKSGNKFSEIRAAWEIPPGNWSVGTEIIHEVEGTINSMNEKWGHGRLRLAAPPELREKFDWQWQRWYSAQWYSTLDGLRDEAARMKRAFAALEKAALDAGVQPAAREQWVVGLKGGRQMVLVPTRQATYRDMDLPANAEVWSLEELAHVVDARDDITRALKERFRGAEILSATPVPEFVDDDPADIR